MRRIGLVLTVVVVAIGSTIMSGGPAVALPEPVATVTPSTNLLDGQTVSVAGTDWPASTSLTLQECAFVPSFPESCLSPQHVTTDTAGSFTTPYVVHRFVDHGDCVTTTDVVCVLTVVTADSTFGETFTLRFNIASSQGPDLIVRNRTNGKLLFDNYYTTATSAYTHSIVAGGYWTFAVLVQNDGPANTDITVHANLVAAPFAVQFFYGYFDLTATVTGSGLRFPGVAPGDSRVLAVRFKADPAVPPGTFARVPITATTPRVAVTQDALLLGVATAP
jgi:hypothetical protein